MQELEGVGHDINKHSLCTLRRLAALLQADFRKLDIPVAENIPDKVIDFLSGNAELKFFKVIRNLFDKIIIEAQNPLILK